MTIKYDDPSANSVAETRKLLQARNMPRKSSVRLCPSYHFIGILLLAAVGHLIHSISFYIFK